MSASERAVVTVKNITKGGINHGDVLMRLRSSEDLEMIRRAIYYYLEKRRYARERYVKITSEAKAKKKDSFLMEILPVDLESDE